MRLRQTCKCGSEFEARGAARKVGQLWHHWQGIHSLCYGIRGWEFDDDGKLIQKPLLPEQREQMAELE